MTNQVTFLQKSAFGMFLRVLEISNNQRRGQRLYKLIIEDLLPLSKLEICHFKSLNIWIPKFCALRLPWYESYEICAAINNVIIIQDDLGYCANVFATDVNRRVYPESLCIDQIVVFKFFWSILSNYTYGLLWSLNIMLIQGVFDQDLPVETLPRSCTVYLFHGPTWLAQHL